MSEKSGYVSKLLENAEDVRQLRMALGLPEPRLLPTFRALAAEWFEAVAKRFVCPANERRHIDRLLAAIGDATEDTLLPGDIQRALNAMEDLGPSTKNKIRSTGFRIVQHARFDGKWKAGNPFEPVRRFKVPRPAYDVLTLEEARKVLGCVRPDRADLFTVAMVMGGRNGELFALRKEDVDLETRSMWFRRSHGRDTTKTSRPRQVPIPQAAVEPLHHAIDSSPSELVFPREDGSRFRADTKLTRVLRLAMAAAGIVTGYDAKCRRKGCGHTERMEFHEERTCSKCGFVLWLVPLVRRIRFYDLRHTAATLHREAGCDPLVIKLLLGHKSQDPTDDIYSHLSHEYQRLELDRLKI